MQVLKEKIKLGDSPLSTSELFRLIQDVSADHCRQWSLGMDELAEKGLIWVVVRQSIKLSRYPEPGEEISISTWPGATRHMMFPRYYIFRDSRGEIILQGSAIWTIVDMKSRKMIIPEKYGLSLEGLVTGEEISLPSAPKKAETEFNAEFTVPQEYLDSNMHMNNTRYYDMCERCMGLTPESCRIKEALTEYISEATVGEHIKLSWGSRDGGIFITGENEGPVFRMNLRYF